MLPFQKEPGVLKDDGIGGIILFVFIIGICVIVYKVAVFLIDLVTNNMGFILFVIFLICLVVFLKAGFIYIPPGHKGLKISQGKRTHLEYTEGWWNWATPYLEKIVTVDCTQRRLSTKKLEVHLANFIPCAIYFSGYYKVGNLYNYFENYERADFEQKVTADVITNMREYFTTNVANEKELLNLASKRFSEAKLTEINNNFLPKIGLEVSHIDIENYELSATMTNFYTLLNQADIMALQKHLPYKDALRNVLIMNGMINDNQYHVNSDTLIQGLMQLKRVSLLKNNTNNN